LNRLDAEMMPAAGARPFGFDSMLVDMAHARWAVGTAATPIDLCAAVIGRLCRCESADRLPPGRRRRAPAAMLLTQRKRSASRPGNTAFFSRRGVGYLRCCSDW
jgi:hypothetical protein